MLGDYPTAEEAQERMRMLEQEHARFEAEARFRNRRLLLALYQSGSNGATTAPTPAATPAAGPASSAVANPTLPSSSDIGSKTADELGDEEEDVDVGPPGEFITGKYRRRHYQVPFASDDTADDNVPPASGKPAPSKATPTVKDKCTAKGKSDPKGKGKGKARCRRTVKSTIRSAPPTRICPTRTASSAYPSGTFLPGSPLRRQQRAGNGGVRQRH
jgi:hypothetical protein